MARILRSFKRTEADADAVCAALLHDVVEDTPHTLIDIEREFGSSVASLVDALTHRKQGMPREEEDRAYLTQIRERAQTDERVALLKLADVLHNSEDLQVFPAKRRAQRAAYLRDWYAPLAEQFGMDAVAAELRRRAENVTRTAA